MRPGPPLRDMGRTFYAFWYPYFLALIVVVIFAAYHLRFHT